MGNFNNREIMAIMWQSDLSANRRWCKIYHQNRFQFQDFKQLMTTKKVKMMKLLEMNNIERYYKTPAGVVKALDGIDLVIHEGERVILSGPFRFRKNHSSQLLVSSRQSDGWKLHLPRR